MRGIVAFVAVSALAGCTLDRAGRDALQNEDGSGLAQGGGARGTTQSGGSSARGGAAAIGGGSAVGGASGGGNTGGSILTGGSGGTGGMSPTCPTSAGPAMVLVAHAQGAFCMDSTEVTSAQYQAFLDTAAVPNLPSECSWKQSHIPRLNNNDCQPKHFEPESLPDRPVACVDWCDAFAFCQWSGKRLCGAVGGGPVDFNVTADAGTNEWFHACSNGGANTFPYGNTYVANACVGDDFDGVSGDGSSDDAEDVASVATCEGGIPGLYDLSGNVWEWTNSCNSSGSDEDNRCRDRGGSFWDGENPYLPCSGVGPTGHTRSYFNKNIGFRCCATPQ